MLEKSLLIFLYRGSEMNAKRPVCLVISKTIIRVGNFPGVAQMTGQGKEMS
jgi:hypothetical protein